MEDKTKMINISDCSGGRSRTGLFSLGLTLIMFLALFLIRPVNSGAQEAYPVIFEALNKAVLSAERAGVLKKLKHDSGDKVKKGTVLGEVDTGEIGLRKKRSQLALKHLNVQVENLSKLRKRGLATNEELDKARMERDITRTDVEIFKRQIGTSRIRAPYSCLVVKRLVQPHEWVTAGQPVIEVVDPAKIRAVANIPSGQAAGMEKGMTHEFFVHDLDISVNGTVKALVPRVDELSNTTQVIWSIGKTPKKMLPGMKGEIRIEK